MFTVKTYLAPSWISGTGVFASEFIKKGTIIWEFVFGFDVKLTNEMFEALPIQAKAYLLNFAYYNEAEGGWVLCSDNAKYTNHADAANMQAVNLIESIATRDIQKDEEITENYYGFDLMADKKLKN